jgi:DNA-binding LacI/PurR family transcriptional regulator
MHGLDDMVRGNPRARLFETTSGAGPGRHLARHLCSLGHRRIAFIYPEPVPQWSANRCAGLQEEISSMGGEVARFAFPQLPFSDVGAIHPSESAKLLHTFLPRNRPGHHLGYGLPTRISDELAYRISGYVQGQLARETVFPILETALARHDITAWVGATDTIAADSLDFLRMRKVAVPMHVSVAGFDDSTVASTLKLTSYNFNNIACIQAMLNHILHPALHRGNEMQGVVRIKGFVTTRLSTAKVRAEVRLTSPTR